MKTAIFVRNEFQSKDTGWLHYLIEAQGEQAAQIGLIQNKGLAMRWNMDDSGQKAHCMETFDLLRRARFPAELREMHEFHIPDGWRPNIKDDAWQKVTAQPSTTKQDKINNFVTKTTMYFSESNINDIVNELRYGKNWKNKKAKST